MANQLERLSWSSRRSPFSDGTQCPLMLAPRAVGYPAGSTYGGRPARTAVSVLTTLSFQVVALRRRLTNRARFANSAAGFRSGIRAARTLPDAARWPVISLTLSGISPGRFRIEITRNVANSQEQNHGAEMAMKDRAPKARRRPPRPPAQRPADSKPTPESPQEIRDLLIQDVAAVSTTHLVALVLGKGTRGPGKRSSADGRGKGLAGRSGACSGG